MCLSQTDLNCWFVYNFCVRTRDVILINLEFGHPNEVPFKLLDCVKFEHYVQKL